MARSVLVIVGARLVMRGIDRHGFGLLQALGLIVLIILAVMWLYSK